jgi:hypothetical protein
MNGKQRGVFASDGEAGGAKSITFQKWHGKQRGEEQNRDMILAEAMEQKAD